MKFVHIADVHFDMPFTLLNTKADLGEIRRMDQRKSFKKMIDYIKENKIPYLFISGDLYEHEYIRESTIDYINNLFEEISETKVFITPGNHDPYLKNSYYNKYNWASNVKIFGPEIEKVELNDINIYGYGFDDFYCHNSGIEELELNDKDKINILVIHASLAGSRDDEKNYNVVSEKELKEKGFDYVALGHIHKRNMEEGNNIIYPGSFISLGFDELGEHGMIVGDITKDKLYVKFIDLDDKQFKEKEMDISETNTIEEIAEKMNNLELQQNVFYKIILIGTRNFEIDVYRLNKLLVQKNVIKIKDETKIKYNLEEIANDVTLKGLYAKEMLNKLKNTEDRTLVEKAIEIGMDIL